MPIDTSPAAAAPLDQTPHPAGALGSRWHAWAGLQVPLLQAVQQMGVSAALIEELAAAEADEFSPVALQAHDLYGLRLAWNYVCQLTRLYVERWHAR
jgi:hypothetical protein